MCQTCFTKDKTIDSVREFCELIGADNVTWTAPEMAWGGVDQCLCHVDVEASATKAGWDAEWDDFGFKLTKKVI